MPTPEGKYQPEEKAMAQRSQVICPGWNSKFMLSIDTPTITNPTRGFPGGSIGKESACNEEDLGSIPE